MTSVNVVFLTVMVLAVLAWMTQSATAISDDDRDRYVRVACRITQHRDVCIRSLASYSDSRKRSPSHWARAAVSVTIKEAKHVEQYLTRLWTTEAFKGRDRMALLDCIECFKDSISNLHDSIGVLRRLNAKIFDTQMGNVETWMSAALTDEGTCLDGFSDGKRRRQVKLLQKKVLNVTYVTSNALAFVNKLASTGTGSFTNP